MVHVILIAITGGLMNWIRGGNALTFAGKKFGEVWAKRLNAVDKTLNDIAYAMVMIFPLPILNFYSFLVLLASMWIGRAPGWGTYIGNIIKKEVQDFKEVQWIDDLVFAGKKDYPRLRSVVALGLRGIMWSTALAGGLFVAYAFMNAVPPTTLLLLIPAGAAFGLIVLASVEIMGLIKGQHEEGRSQGWPLSEVLMGVYLWPVAYLLGV